MTADALDRAVALALGPLDALRASLLRATAPALRPALARRELRVGLYGLATVASALALTAAAPLWLLLVAPLTLGVAHLASDLRYLVARQGLHRRRGFAALVALPLAATWALPRAPVGALAVLGAASLARGPTWKRALVAAAALALGAFAVREHRLVGVALAHAHHLVALALWWAWARGRDAWRLCVAAAFALGALAIGAGALDAAALRPWALRAPAAGFDLGRIADELSPVAPSGAPIAAARWALAFAFAQSVHYGLWLRLLPEEDRARPGLRGFTRSWECLARDLGRPLALAVPAAAAVFMAWGALDAVAARGAYLRLAFFHGYLELAVAGLLWCEGTLRREATP